MLEMKIAISYGDAQAIAPVKLGEGLVGLRRAPQGAGAGPRRLEGLALHQRGQRRALRAGDSAAAQGSLHRRVRSRKPGARRLLEEARRAADAAGVAGGGRDRERAALRSDPRQRAAAREGSALRAARADGAAAAGAAEEAARASTSRGTSIPARELGGDLYEFLSPEPNTLVVAVGDVSGKGVPAALYSSFVGEVVRGRTFRRRFTPERGEPGGGADVDQPHPARAAARGVLLHALLRALRSQAAHRDASPTPGCPIRCACRATRSAQIELPGVPLGSFGGSTYDEVTRRPARRATSSSSARTASPRRSTRRARSLAPTRDHRRSCRSNRDKPAKEIVDAVFGAMQAFRGDAEQTDDQTVVVVKIAPGKIRSRRRS